MRLAAVIAAILIPATALCATEPESVTEDWSLDAQWFGTTPGQTALTRTSPATGITYTSNGVYILMPNQIQGYLYMGANDRTEGGTWVEFALPFDCDRMVMHTASASSTVASNAVNIYAGGTLIHEKVGVNVQHADVAVDIPQGARSRGTVYRIESYSVRQGMFTSFTYFRDTSSAARIEVPADALEFAAPAGAVQQREIEVSISDVPGTLTATTDSPAFSVGPEVFEAPDGQVSLTVTYLAAYGDASATLTLSGGGAEATAGLLGVAADHEGTAADPLTTDDVAAMRSLNPGPFHVSGIILGRTLADQEATESADTPAEEPDDTHILLADPLSGTEVTVMLPEGEMRRRLNIADNPANIGEEALIIGQLADHGGIPAVTALECLSDLPGSVSDIMDIGVSTADTAPVRYLDLRGIPVSRPCGGPYIRITGTRAEKVIL